MEDEHQPSINMNIEGEIPIKADKRIHLSKQWMIKGDLKIDIQGKEAINEEIKGEILEQIQ